ncbi:MAG: ABC transporter permease [Chloroflexi bacterium]|nr:ABC transporter permease [Chloroflexota bacterium]
MIAYLLRRVIQAILVVIVVTMIVFGLLQLLPGGPAHAVLGSHATAAAVAAFNKANGLDQPVFVQYGIWFSHLVQGNLGYSYNQNQSVASLIGERLPKTLALTITSVILAMIIGVAIGTLQAIQRNRAFDYAATSAAFLFYSFPPFFLALLLIILLAVDIHLLPAQAPQVSSVWTILTDPQALILPVVTLAVTGVAIFSRYMRSSVIDNLLQDYVRTAHAKGVGSVRLLVVHVFRNALLPVVTLVGLFLPVLLSGAVVVESVFNYPGMGLLFWNAATSRDYPTELGVTVLVGVLTVVGSLLADILYAVLDPRVRYVRR